MSRPSGVLHVTNGDSCAGLLRDSGLPGTLSVWADVLHEGPVPPDDDMEAWLETRARFHAGPVWSYQDALAIGRKWQQALAGFAGYDELVFWFEHDLFDQLLLIRHLAWLDRQDRGDTAIRLICIGEHPGVEPFFGLGQLTPSQLAGLYPTRQPVTPDQYALSRRAWAGFTSSDPRDLDQMAREDYPALPFLGTALRRFLQEYPSARNGLPRTENQVLRALESGPLSPSQLYRRSQEAEEARFMGDLTLWERVEELARDPNPLVQLAVQPRPDRLPDGRVSITETGRAVLTGAVDWAKVHRLDRWLGGVHLESDKPHWRWTRDSGLRSWDPVSAG